jgi:hypothetical protein
LTLQKLTCGGGGRVERTAGRWQTKFARLRGGI